MWGRPKYNNQITEVDGIKFRSKKEARRYRELKWLLKSGAIKDLVLQPRFPIVVNTIKICTYVADFEYVTQQGVRIIEEVKGFETPEWKLKQKLFNALYPKEKLVVIK